MQSDASFDLSKLLTHTQTASGYSVVVADTGSESLRGLIGSCWHRLGQHPMTTGCPKKLTSKGTLFLGRPVVNLVIQLKNILTHKKNRAMVLKFWKISPPPVCHVNNVTCHISCVTYHMTYDNITTKLLELGSCNFDTVITTPVCYMSHDIFHVSHVICHLSPITFWKWIFLRCQKLTLKHFFASKCLKNTQNIT